MTLEDAILHCYEKANDLKNEAEHLLKDSIDYEPCLECAKEHEQLAKWLEELKDYKDGRSTCEFCKHKFRTEYERPCSLCKHNFSNKFEPEDTEEQRREKEQAIIDAFDDTEQFKKDAHSLD